MNIYFLIFLRIVHIFAGVLWVGSAIFFLFLVKPTIISVGPSGPQFMQNLVGRQRMPQYMGMVSLLTVLAGALLYWNSSGGLQLAWITSGPGIGFTIGSLVGIAVFLMGTFMIGPTAEKLGVLGNQIASNGGTPTPAQAADLQNLDNRLTLLERLDFVMLTISLLTMATARFWVF